MAIKSFFKNIFLLRITSKQTTNLVNFTVSLGIWAIALSLLLSWGESYMYLAFIPTEVKVIIANIIYLGAFIFACIFLIRFILGFFIHEKENTSPEQEALSQLEMNLSIKLDKLIEVMEEKKSNNGNSKPTR